MAVREFDGVDDVIAAAVGGCASIGAGPFTVAWLVKLTANDGAPVYFGPASGGSSAVRFVATPFGTNWDGTTNGSTYQSFVGRTLSEWTLVAVSKAAGSATPRAHRYNYTAATWTHADATGALPDATAAAETIRFGHFRNESQFLDGRLAVVGAWDTVLSDGAVEGLTDALSAWVASAPVGLWAFNQDDVGDPVLDLTDGGADQASITGTTVVTGDDPPGFDFALDVPPAEITVDVPVTVALATTTARPSEVDTGHAVGLTLATTTARASEVATDHPVDVTLATTTARASRLTADPVVEVTFAVELTDPAAPPATAPPLEATGYHAAGLAAAGVHDRTLVATGSHPT